MSDQANKLLALVNQLRWDQKKNSLTAEDVDTVENALLELQRLERSALTSHEPKVCEWVKIETDETLEYIPSCHGAVVYMNNVAGFKFCPYCGRPIQVKDGGK